MEKNLGCCMKKRVYLVFAFLIFLVSVAWFNSARQAQAADKALLGVRDLFIGMEKSLQNKDEAAFKALWHHDGYNYNPTGDVGYSGAQAYKKGSRDGWYIKPDFKELLTHGLADVIKSDDVVIIPCHIWSVEKHKPIDDIYTAIVHSGNEWLVLGLSENAKGLEGVVDRFKNPWAP